MGAMGRQISSWIENFAALLQKRSRVALVQCDSLTRIVVDNLYCTRLSHNSLLVNISNHKSPQQKPPSALPWLRMRVYRTHANKKSLHRQYTLKNYLQTYSSIQQQSLPTSPLLPAPLLPCLQYSAEIESVSAQKFKWRSCNSKLKDYLQ